MSAWHEQPIARRTLPAAARRRSSLRRGKERETESERIDCIRSIFLTTSSSFFFSRPGVGFPKPAHPPKKTKKASMVFDADPLWWPPAARLHATLTSSAAAAADASAAAAASSPSKNGNVRGDGDVSPSSSTSAAVAAAQRLSATLKEHERWLIAGLHTFKRRGGAGGGGSSGDSASSSSSRAALLAGAPLSLNRGAKKIAVDGRLVQAALELAVVAVSIAVSS